MSRPMNDDEVLNELNKMVAFIKQEALEKAREIKVKADEEFAIEKAKLVKQEQLAIDTQYEKKLKGAEVSQKIAQSTLTNKSRLKLLHRREEHLQDLFSTCRNQVVSLSSSNSDAYSKFLVGILSQGYLYLMEPSVVVHCRESDVPVLEEAASKAANRYKETSGRDINVDVKGTLSDDTAGGVKLASGSGRITLDNTLDERLRLLEDRFRCFPKYAKISSVRMRIANSIRERHHDFGFPMVV